MSAPVTTNKYDRQIRIWGDDGQSALQKASVCVLGASATATEILKNLVLPGIAAFTIVDGRDICAEDYATNFFLTTPSSSLPSSPTNRAQAVVNAMRALNESVQGSYIAADPASFLTSTAHAAAFLRPFSFVVVTQRSARNPVSRHVARACARLRLPLLLARAYGQVGTVRVQLVEHCVHDARSGDPPDLRLHAPFAELTEQCERAFTGDGDADHAHVPFVYILARAVSTFKQRNAGRLPDTRAEKDEFAAIVRESRPEKCPEDALNYAEALRFANLRMCHAASARIPPDVAGVLQAARARTSQASPMKKDGDSVACNYGVDVDCEVVGHEPLPKPVRLDRRHPAAHTADCDALASDRARWWACASGVSDFVEREQVLPLAGRIPDMTSDTASYIALQRVYASKASHDADQVLQYATRSGVQVSRDAAVAFCKRVHDVRLVRTRTIDEELDDARKSGFAEAARGEGAMDEASCSTCASPFYAALRAADVFESEFGRLPGSVPESRADDVAQMHALVAKVRDSLGVGAGAEVASWRDVTEEVVRYAGAEMHCVAAFVGGVAAQEVTKIITRQFVPLQDCIIFNMANMTSATFAA